MRFDFHGQTHLQVYNSPRAAQTGSYDGRPSVAVDTTLDRLVLCCHDNAVAESLFKRERIRRRTYETRGDARRGIFDYIEMFNNPKRKRARNGMLSPVEYENRQQNVNQDGVLETRGYSNCATTIYGPVTFVTAVPEQCIDNHPIPIDCRCFTVAVNDTDHVFAVLPAIQICIIVRSLHSFICI